MRRDTITPLEQRLGEARHAEGLAKAEGAELLGAAESPFDHPRARKTAGYSVRIGRRWGEVITAADTKSPACPASITRPRWSHHQARAGP